MILVVLLGLAAALALPAQTPRFKAVGLVMSPGATVQRGRVKPVAVPAGELLFAGDVVRSGSQKTVTFLFCPERISATLPVNSQVVVRETSLEAAGVQLADRKPVAGCYMPEMPKLSLASQQHFGVMLARTGSIPPPTTTLAERIAVLPEDVREELTAALDDVDSILDHHPQSAAAHVSRASTLEKAGLLFDAGESYRKAASLFPEAAWIRRKIYAIEDELSKTSGH